MGQTYGHSLTAVTDTSVPLSHFRIAWRVLGTNCIGMKGKQKVDRGDGVKVKLRMTLTPSPLSTFRRAWRDTVNEERRIQKQPSPLITEMAQTVDKVRGYTSDFVI